MEIYQDVIGCQKFIRLVLHSELLFSALGSPLYNVARFLHEIIDQSIKKPKSHIENGWFFVNIVKNATINDEILTSLDVSSLFTNIPKELVTKAKKIDGLKFLRSRNSTFLNFYTQ